MRKERGQPSLADLSRTAAGHSTAFVEASATIGNCLMYAEIDLLAAARRIEWAAVQHPELSSTARVAYFAAHRVRGDRLAVAA